jgi:cytochrome P450
MADIFPFSHGPMMKSDTNATPQETGPWSCYTTSPQRSLEIFEEARAQCPVAHSQEHNGFYLLLNDADVKRAMADHKTFSSVPQVLRPDLVHELAEPVPAETICRLVGIDDALVPKVRAAALAMFAAQGNPDEFGRRQAVFAALTLPEVHGRRTRPRDDYLTRLATFDIEGRRTTRTTWACSRPSWAPAITAPPLRWRA